MQIIAAPNAFKGSLTAAQAAAAMTRGILDVFPDCSVISVPVADGGDGLTEVLADALGGTILAKTVMGPLMEPFSAPFTMVTKQQLAVVEMARASGLVLLKEDLRNPINTSSYGTGELIRAALDEKAARIIVGLGGSATCDGGIGMAQALGYRFLTRKGKEVSPTGGALKQIEEIDATGIDLRLSKVQIEAVCDVRNPLVGENGASQVYSPQKGASADEVRELDEGLAHLAAVIQRDLGVSMKDLPGAGAAGGMGGGLYAFLGAKLRPGIELVLDIVGLEEKMQGTDLVLTGEGHIDFQTKFDKAPAGVAKAAKKNGVNCIAICGSVGEQIHELHEIGIDAVFSICNRPLPLEYAMKEGYALLAEQTQQVVRTFFAGKKLVKKSVMSG